MWRESLESEIKLEPAVIGYFVTCYGQLVIWYLPFPHCFGVEASFWRLRFTVHVVQRIFNVIQEPFSTFFVPCRTSYWINICGQEVMTGFLKACLQSWHRKADLSGASAGSDDFKQLVEPGKSILQCIFNVSHEPCSTYFVPCRF